MQVPEPPKWASSFLEWYCHPDLMDEIQGDLTEQYFKNTTNKGQRSAQAHYIIDVIKFFRPSSFKKTQISIQMDILKNYLKVALRVFKKEKAYTFTNLLGLTLGLVCSLFIYLWINDELSYNQFTENKDKLHYVSVNMPENGKMVHWQGTPYPLMKVLKEQYPAIKETAIAGWGNDLLIRKNEQQFQEIDGVYATPSIINFLSRKIIAGNLEFMNDNTMSIALAESEAIKYFGPDWQNQSVIGKTLEDNNNNSYQLAVVFEDIPERSTLQFDFLVPYAKKLKDRPYLDSWGNYSNRLFVLIDDQFNTEQATENIQDAVKDHRPQEDNAELFLQAFSDMYLYSNFENGKVSGGRIDYVRILSIAGILILVLASINFINLTTAKSTKRSKETGVRKVMGAARSGLRAQFILESLLITTTAFMLALALLFLLLPYFNHITGKSITPIELPLNIYFNMFFAMLAVGMISGIYPALFMSKIDPVRSMKGILKVGKSGHSIRKSLVTIQFVITTLMIIGSAVIYKQLDFIFTRNTGIDRSNVVRTFMGDMDPSSTFKIYKEKLLGMPGIQSVATCNNDPLRVGNSTSDPTWTGKSPDDEQNFHVLGVDPEFISMMNISVIAGRNFDWQLRSDSANYIINESAAKAMNLADPIGQELSFWDNKGTIIGLVKDFNFQTMHEQIDPLIIYIDPDPWMILTKIKPGQTKEAIASLEKLHNEFNGHRTFYLSFLDDEYAKRYKSEQMVSQVSLIFTVVAVIISCLGLLGLVTFSTQLRTKEIGIRKVLGASTIQLLKILSSEFIVLITIAIIIAIPFAHFILEDWLNNFAFRINLNVIYYLLAAGVTICLALLTLGQQTIRLTMKNPVESLRDE